MTDRQNMGYVLGMHGDAWAIDGGKMRGYLSTLIVDVTPATELPRGGPIDIAVEVPSSRLGNVAYYDCDGEPLVLSQHPTGGKVREAVATRKTKKAIAVVPIHGPITNRASIFTAFFGGTSTDKLGRVFDSLIESQAVGAIVLDVDSPGGIVYGVPELAEKIFKARGSKPIVAVSNAQMFSAAYYIASAADQVVVTPSGQTGSIGVWSLHVDYSSMLEQEGIDATFISAGERKVWGNPYEPLTDEARAMLQTEVDSYYNAFVGAVAKHRGVTAKAVRDGFGRGGTVTASESKAEGLADRVDTLENTIRRMGGNVAERDQIAADHQRRTREIEGLEG